MTESELFNKILDTLKKVEGVVQVEEYSGLFNLEAKEIKQTLIIPPALFLEIDEGNRSEKRDYENQMDIVIYAITNNMISNSQTTQMLDLIKLTKETMYKEKFSRLSYKGYRNFANLPGLKIYTINFTVTN